MGLPEVLQSIKNAEESADAKIAASKEEAAKLISEARKEALELIQKAQDDSVSSTVATLDSARERRVKKLAQFMQKEPRLLKRCRIPQVIDEKQP